MVEAKNISVKRGGKWILRQANIRVLPGHFTAVIGANGAGKSTLLKVLAGAEKPDAGQVLLNGDRLSDYKERELAQVRGILSQQLHLPFSIRVLDVVLLGRHIHTKREGKRTSEKAARQCLRQVGLAGYENRDIRTLSGGEQQRVHLARVLAQITHQENNHGCYLLLDEPTASQDMAQQLRLLSLLRQLAKEQQIGIIAILHDINQAAQYADQVLLLKSGHVIAIGSPKEVITPENIQTAYGIIAGVYQHPRYNTLQVFAHHFPHQTKN